VAGGGKVRRQPGDNLADFYIQTTSSSRFWPNAVSGGNGNSKVIISKTA